MYVTSNEDMWNIPQPIDIAIAYIAGKVCKSVLVDIVYLVAFNGVHTLPKAFKNQTGRAVISPHKHLCSCTFNTLFKYLFYFIKLY